MTILIFLEALISSLYFKFLTSVDVATPAGLKRLKQKTFYLKLDKRNQYKQFFSQRQKPETRLYSTVVPVKVPVSVDEAELEDIQEQLF